MRVFCVTCGASSFHRVCSRQIARARYIMRERAADNTPNETFMMKHSNVPLTAASLVCLHAGDHMLALQHHAAPLSAAGVPGLEGIAGVVQGRLGGAGSGSGTPHQPGSHVTISFWGPGLSIPGVTITGWYQNQAVCSAFCCCTLFLSTLQLFDFCSPGLEISSCINIRLLLGM